MNLKRAAYSILSIIMCFAMAIGLVACEVNEPSDSSGKGSSSSISDSQTSSSSSASDAGADSSSQKPNDSSAPAEEEKVYVADVHQNEDFLLFEANKAEKTEKQTEFYDRNQVFAVGDDNAFVVKPVVSFIKMKGNMPVPYVPDEWNYVITVSRYTENNEYVELTEADLDTFTDSIDEKNATVDFSEEAVGEKFKVSVYPEGLDSEDIAEKTQTIEVSVVDAYNVYSAKELAYIENGSRTDAATNQAWSEFKTANKLDGEAKTALVLQKNINITLNDLPSCFFYTSDEIGANDADRERAVGSLKDSVSLYQRTLGENEEFSVIGNYFTLNCSAIPVVVRASGNIMQEGQAFASHSNLIMFNSELPSEQSNSKVELKNVNLIGNAPRVEDTAKTGGIIMFKTQNIETYAYNNISNNFFITYFPNFTDKNYTMEKCKSYNAYSCFVYNYGSKDVHIKNCEFLQAGGPVIIADHVTNTDSDKPSAVIVENSNLHSYVTGQEAWFQMYSATAIAAQLLPANTAFTPFGRSFVKTQTTGSDTANYLDLVAVYKANQEQITDTKITGKFVEDDGVAFDFGTYTDPWTGFANVDQTNPKNMFIEGVLSINKQAPIFMTSGGGISFLNPEVGLMTLQGQTPTQILDPADNMFKGNQLYMIYNRMGIVFNYFNAGETL